MEFYNLKREYFVIRHITFKLFIQVFQSLFSQPLNYSALQAQKSRGLYSKDVSTLGHLKFKVQSRNNDSSATNDSKSHGNY